MTLLALPLEFLPTVQTLKGVEVRNNRSERPVALRLFGEVAAPHGLEGLANLCNTWEH
jgi:hypothetical protein